MTALDAPVAAPPTVTAAPSDLSSRFVGRKYVQLVLVLGSLSAIGPLTIDTYLPALPELSRQLGATDAQAQATITGLLIGLGFGQLIIGPLSDSVGRRKPLLAGLVLHALMSVLCALAPEHRSAHRDPHPAGCRRCRRGRRRDGRGPRPVQRHPCRSAALPPRARARRRTDPGPVPGQCAAGPDVVARHLRGARRHRPGHARARVRGPAGDPARRAPAAGQRDRLPAGVRITLPGPPVHRDGAGGRADVRHPVRLHLRARRSCCRTCTG